MASPKLIALFFAFAVAAAALQPSEAARVQQAQHGGFKPEAAANQAAEKVADQQADGGVPRPPGTPGAVQIPPQLLPAILGMLFPPLGGIIGLLQPLFPAPGSPAALQGGGGVFGLGGGIGSAPPPPPSQPITECMTPLVGMLPCTDYLTNVTVLTPPGECCAGLTSTVRDGANFALGPPG